MPGLAGPINGFRGPYRWLSNFWPAPVRLDGVVYPTVEHAYQAAKTLDRAERALIARLTSPGAAKRSGRRVTMRDDWDGVKLDVMLGLLRGKFARGDLRARLLSTGDVQLIEDNTWGDHYWGVCRGDGQNHLGRLLMQVRDELRESS